MCVDFMDLNKACPKNLYLLSNIDHLVDNMLGFKMLSFGYVFTRYNQFKMHPKDDEQSICRADEEKYGVLCG